MQRYEYRVIPAPRRGEKARGAKTAPERFGVALTTLMNQMGQDGWDFLRADTLPCEERVGLTGRSISFQSMLVFRRDTVVDDTVHAWRHGAEPATMPPLTSDPAGGPAPRLGAAVTLAGPARALGPATGPDISPASSQAVD